MRSITLYSEKNTPIHLLQPMTKVLYVAVVVLTPLLAGSWQVSLAVILLDIMALRVGQVLRKTTPIVGLSLIILSSVVIIQGLFRQGDSTPAFSLGALTFYREGLRYALSIALNMLNIILSFSILILTTKPSNLVEAFVRIGLPPKFGYVLGSVFQIVPQMSESMETITDAQRSRGMETEGGLLTRIKAFFPLISPVVMNSLIMTKERAIALEVRGFSATGSRTFLSESKDGRHDKIIKIILLFALTAALAWRIYLWLA